MGIVRAHMCTIVCIGLLSKGNVSGFLLLQVGVLPTPGLMAGETVAVLELVRPLEEMRGEYRCRATNFVGEDEKALNILVNGQ